MTRIAPIRYYQGRVAYPSKEQMRQAESWLDLDFGDGGRPTEDVDCTHLQRIKVRGPSAQIRSLDEQKLQRFFDLVGYKRGFRVLTHETDTDSVRGEVTIVHDIVYVIESQPTSGYVKLTLKSELPKPDQRSSEERAKADADFTAGLEDLLQAMTRPPRGE